MPITRHTGDCRIEDFRAVVEQATDLDDYPYADAVEHNVLDLRPAPAPPRHHTGGPSRRAGGAGPGLADGPGIVVFKGAFDDTSVVDRASAVFDAMIAEQRAAGATVGDHFAKPGTNDRVWGALDKFAIREPQLFADYYANEMIALVCEAWLGPNYQVTSQVNVVNPGGTAQLAHRDYHLGFMSAQQSSSYPAHVHRLSPLMTLQGAVAHFDMRVETGPTMYLPHSQKYGARLPRVPPAGVHRLLRRALRPAPARQGRRRVLQPGRLPRGGHQPVGRRQAHGQPAAGVVRVRTRHLLP